MFLKQDIKSINSEKSIDNLGGIKIKNLFIQSFHYKNYLTSHRIKKGSNGNEFTMKLIKLSYIFMGPSKSLRVFRKVFTWKKVFVKF